MVCQPLYCPRLGTLRWKGRLYVCSTVDRAEQFGADPEMFLLGVATLLHRCNIAMIYFSFLSMKTLTFQFLRFSRSGCPHLRLSWTPRRRRSSQRSARWNNEHIFAKSPSCSYEPKLLVRSAVRTSHKCIYFSQGGKSDRNPPCGCACRPKVCKQTLIAKVDYSRFFSCHHVKPV